MSQEPRRILRLDNETLDQILSIHPNARGGYSLIPDSRAIGSCMRSQLSEWLRQQGVSLSRLRVAVTGTDVYETPDTREPAGDTRSIRAVWWSATDGGAVLGKVLLDGHCMTVIVEGPGVLPLNEDTAAREAAALSLVPWLEQQGFQDVALCEDGFVSFLDHADLTLAVVVLATTVVSRVDDLLDATEKERAQQKMDEIGASRLVVLQVTPAGLVISREAA